MPSYAYSEDTRLECEEITEDDIADCSDLETLRGWYDDLEILIEDIQAQLRGYAISEIDNLAWVYRACNRLGYLNRGVGRIRRKMRALGDDPNPLGTKLHEAQRKFGALKAESAVASEFKRLAMAAMPQDRYAELESAAVHAVAQRAKAAREEAA